MNLVQKSLIYATISTFIFGSVFNLTQATNITRWEAFEVVGNSINTPSSSQYIDLYYKDITPSDLSYQALQKLVYAGKLDNKTKNVYPNIFITRWQLYNLLAHVADKNIHSVSYLQGSDSIAQTEDLKNIDSLFWTIPIITIEKSSIKSNIDSGKLEILNDVYNTLNMNHYESEDFTSTQLIDSAIEGLAKWAMDQHTAYFPPAKNIEFQSGLEGKYEWIGAYVDMPEPWIVVIVSPISGSPAEASWIRWWDIVYSVDGRVVKKTDTLIDITALIKWPAGSKVNLEVIRDGEKIQISVIRWNIIINDIEAKTLNSSTYYIQMKMFSGSVAKQFTTVLEKLATEKNVEKIVIDLRNNPGWYLDQVVDILWHFIEIWENVAVVKYKDSTKAYISYGYDTYDFSDKEIVILINSGTASASEILAWTLKDYFPERVTIIWEKSFWKWSVQTQRYYRDGSALKYTIAKWYTWKNEKWIDWVGIEPDTQIIFDQNLWREKQIDNQLQEAIK